jgi:hypothetical protein
MDYNERFNETFKEFMQDLIRVFPEDVEFRMYELAIQSTMTYYPTYVGEMFFEKVTVPFEEKIMQRDSTFFLTHDYTDVLHNPHKEANAVIEKIKDCWVNMVDENKDIVWKYFRVLVLLSKKIRT